MDFTYQPVERYRAIMALLFLLLFGIKLSYLICSIFSSKSSQLQKKASKRKLPERKALHKSQKPGNQVPSLEKKPRKANSRETKRAKVKNGAKIRTTSRNR